MNEKIPWWRNGKSRDRAIRARLTYCVVMFVLTVEAGIFARSWVEKSIYDPTWIRYAAAIVLAAYFGKRVLDHALGREEKPTE